MTRMSCDLLQQLQALPDPRRVTRNRKHLLGDVLLGGFCGVLADCNHFVEIADWARHHEDFLRTFLELPSGIPAHDTYNRVLIDAAGCQKDIAAQIVAGGGDSVLAVKDNQPTLHAEVRDAFVSALDNEVAPLRRYGCEEKGHGRRERRVVWIVPAAKYWSCQAAWLGLLTLVMVLRVVNCPVSGAETIETRYFISSLRSRARRIGRVIRGHWMIENGLHWVLDGVFREDARRLYDRRAAENVGLLHRLSASLLRGDTAKGSLAVKRKRAAWNVGYLAQLLGLPIP